MLFQAPGTKMFLFGPAESSQGGRTAKQVTRRLALIFSEEDKRSHSERLPTAADIGFQRREIHEARKLRDAEKQNSSKTPADARKGRASRTVGLHACSE